MSALLQRDDAERLSAKISLRLESMSDAWAGAMPLIREAIEREAYRALGYASHGAYVSDRFGGALGRLGVELRREVARELSDVGLSTRAIAPVLGTSHMTVARDLDAGVTDVTPAQSADRPVTGLDGKTYQPRQVVEVITADADTGEVIDEPRAAPAARRRAITDTAHDIGWEIRKTAEKLQRLAEDDRYPRNKAEVGGHLRGHLQHAIDTYQQILNDIEQ